MSQAQIETRKSGTMISITIRAHDKEAVTAAIEDQFARYHPIGYGTHFEPPRQDRDGWFASGSRHVSCD